MQAFCTRCGKPNPDPRWKSCPPCLEKKREYNKKYNAVRSKQLVADPLRCSRCGAPVVGMAYCSSCLGYARKISAKLPPETRRRYQNTTKKKFVQFILREHLLECIDCGNTDQRILEFDHVRGEKAASPFHIRSTAKLIAEIAKCEVRCPNCHRLRHYRDSKKTSPRAQILEAD